MADFPLKLDPNEVIVFIGVNSNDVFHVYTCNLLYYFL